MLTAKKTASFIFTLMLFVISYPIETFCQGTGSIRGTVRFVGELPEDMVFNHDISPASCGRQAPLDRLILSKNSGVQYTLLYLKNPPTGSTAGMKQAVIDQQHCRYVPHMVIAAKGSSIEMINSDPLLHTSHGYLYKGMERSTAFNIAQPVEGQRTNQQLRKSGMIEIECDAGHVWMSAWIWVTPSPFAAITNENGEYSVDNIPPGTYTLVMWHEGWELKNADSGERPKFSDPIAEEREVTVTAGSTTTVNFELR